MIKSADPVLTLLARISLTFAGADHPPSLARISLNLLARISLNLLARISRSVPHFAGADLTHSAGADLQIRAKLRRTKPDPCRRGSSSSQPSLAIASSRCSVPDPCQATADKARSVPTKKDIPIFLIFIV